MRSALKTYYPPGTWRAFSITRIPADRVNLNFNLTGESRQSTKQNLGHKKGNVFSQRPKSMTPPEHMVKKYLIGSTYDPFDFSLGKVHLERKQAAGRINPNDRFKYINASDLYSNPRILSEYISVTGRILHRDVTGLSAKNQKRISRAIRRAQAIGLLSKTHKDVSFLSTFMPTKG